MATHAQPCTRLHAPASHRRTLSLFLSFALYRTLRRFVDPVFAWRAAFAGRAAS